MTDDRQQRLSALVDGESSASELRATLAETLLDPELTACWERYFLIGRSLRGEPLRTSARQTVAGVAERIALEPVPDVPVVPASADAGLVRSTPGAASRRRRPAATAAGPIVGVALAAGLAVVAVAIGPNLIHSGGLTEPAMVEATPVTPPAILGGDGLNVIDRWAVGEPNVASKLNELLVSHRERAAASGISGLIPYAAVVGYAGTR